MRSLCTIAGSAVLCALAASGWAVGQIPSGKGPAVATKEFEIRNDRPFLGGHEIDLWGIRCGNAFYSDAVTERHVNALDTMAAHGINLIGAYIQGPNAGFPNPDAGLNGFRPDGKLRPEVGRRVEWLAREADRRGMVLMVGVLSPRQDQGLRDEAAIRRAIEETARFLTERKLKNVFVDLMHEFNHVERVHHELLREPNGVEKRQKLTSWFKAIAPDIEAGICPTHKTETTDSYPGMDIRLIQKDMPIPSQGFVVNVEMTRFDYYENDGLFSKGDIAEMKQRWEQYRAAPNAAFLFHAGYIQGISNKSGTAPHPEPGGYGSDANDRGVRFYFDWVRDTVGRWEYPKHVAPSAGAAKEARR